MDKTEIILALGSNIGDRLAAMQAAVEAMKQFIAIEKLSCVFETAAAYVTDQPPFFNAALSGITSLSPTTLLWQIKNIETEIGRLPTFRYGPRLLDIDILAYGNLVASDMGLTIPHPRIADRDFVLLPLINIAPVWIHPQTGLTPAQMLQQLEGRNAIPTAPVNLGPLLHA